VAPRKVAISSPLATAALIPWAETNVRAAFFGRAGGVSQGPYRSLNFAANCGDLPQAVAANWQRLHEFLHPISEVVKLRQVHGNQVHVVSPDAALYASNGIQGQALRGDGLVTTRTGVALAILTADCVPILLYEPRCPAIGALHAGWRGTLGNIAREGVRALVALGACPHRIQAALGPAIGRCCFEIDQELGERFAAQVPAALPHLQPGRLGKAYLDLKGLIRNQLVEAGLSPNAILEFGPCTKCASSRYFSRRAARGGPTGLQGSFIAMP
jgi:YfiH family protein